MNLNPQGVWNVQNQGFPNYSGPNSVPVYDPNMQPQGMAQIAYQNQIQMQNQNHNQYQQQNQGFP